MNQRLSGSHVFAGLHNRPVTKHDQTERSDTRLTPAFMSSYLVSGLDATASRWCRSTHTSHADVRLRLNPSGRSASDLHWHHDRDDRCRRDAAVHQALPLLNYSRSVSISTIWQLHRIWCGPGFIKILWDWGNLCFDKSSLCFISSGLQLHEWLK